MSAPSDPVMAHVQAIVSQTGGLHTLTQLLADPEPLTRCSGMWALANMVYMASPPVTRAVMQALPWTQFQPLLHDSSPEVQVSTHRATDTAYAVMHEGFTQANSGTYRLPLLLISLPFCPLAGPDPSPLTLFSVLLQDYTHVHMSSSQVGCLITLLLSLTGACSLLASIILPFPPPGQVVACTEGSTT